MMLNAPAFYIDSEPSSRHSTACGQELSRNLAGVVEVRRFLRMQDDRGAWAWDIFSLADGSDEVVD